MLFRTLFDSLTPKVSCPPIQPARRGAPRRPPAPCRLAVEALEDRLVPAAVLSIGDVAILEGNAGTHHAEVTVTVSEPHGNAVTVNYSTADGAASAGSDYDAISGKLTFAKDEMSKTILVPIRGDRVVEPQEHFFVRLDSPKGAKIADGEGIVNIADNEPRVRIDDVSALEGHDGATSFAFTVSLSAACDLPVTIDYATSNGTATSGSDYTASEGTFIFAPDQTSHTMLVAVNGDRLGEWAQTFFVNVSSSDSYAMVSKSVGVGTILNDEPLISIGDVWNYGESTFTFTVNLSAACEEDVTFDFATVDGTALAGMDYVAASGTRTIARGDTTMTITVHVLDTTSAANKYFSIHLSGDSTNALIGNESAFGYWYFDDGYYDDELPDGFYSWNDYENYLVYV